MKKPTKIIIWTVAGLVFLAGLVAGGYYGYGQWRVYSYKQAVKDPYIRDAESSLGGDTPLQAYRQFRQALKKGDKERALQYIFVEDREEYRKDLEKQEMVEAYLSMPEAEELEKRGESECGSEALACQKRAEYGYEYEVKETKEIEVWGKTSQLKKGTYSKGLTFIKNLSDKWQIRQL
jgi:uncharacterized membrane protein